MHCTVPCKLLHTYQKNNDEHYTVRRLTEVQLFYSRSYHRLHAVFQRWSENERFESQFIRRGTIGLDCSARSPPALHTRPRVVGVHRDESFQGHDKGLRFGEDTAPLWLNFSTMGWLKI